MAADFGREKRIIRLTAVKRHPPYRILPDLTLEKDGAGWRGAATAPSGAQLGRGDHLPILTRLSGGVQSVGGLIAGAEEGGRG